MKIEESKVKTKSLFWKSFYGDENVFVTMTEWVNGEGFDVAINANKREQILSLTDEELSAIMALYSGWALSSPEAKEKK